MQQENFLSEKETEALREKLDRLMSESGFEITEINGEPIYHSGEKYVRIICGGRIATLELAVGLHNAEKDFYEDIGLYDYGYMRCHGADGIFGAMKDDIVRYVFNA